MRRLSVKIIATAVAILGVLGVGVAVAADPGTCPYGNTPQAGKVAPAKATGDQLRERLRKRDGTGVRHVQRQSGRRAAGPGFGAGNRGADCPYRS